MLVGEWMREVSALLAVFPLIDQLVDDRARVHFSWWVTGVSMACALIFLFIGVALDMRGR